MFIYTTHCQLNWAPLLYYHTLFTFLFVPSCDNTDNDYCTINKHRHMHSDKHNKEEVLRQMVWDRWSQEAIKVQLRGIFEWIYRLWDPIFKISMTTMIWGITQAKHLRTLGPLMPHGELKGLGYNLGAAELTSETLKMTWSQSKDESVGLIYSHFMIPAKKSWWLH